jgi:hypothetical protein
LEEVLFPLILLVNEDSIVDIKEVNADYVLDPAID